MVDFADCGGGADRSAVSGRHSAAAANHSADPVRSIVRPLSASGATCRLAPTRARRDLVDFFDRISVRHGAPHNQRVTAPTRFGARARPPEHAREWTRCRWPPRGQGRPAARAPLDRPACALMVGAVARTGASLVAGGTTSATARPRRSLRGPRRAALHRRRWCEGSVAHQRRQFPRPWRAVR